MNAGSAAWNNRPLIDVKQPIGAFSPYSATPTRSDAASFVNPYDYAESATYVAVEANPIRPLYFGFGARMQTFYFGNHKSLTPRLTVRYRVAKKASINASYAQYSQMPPYPDLLSYDQNRLMKPIKATHYIVGADLPISSAFTLRAEAYSKVYRDVPASTEYPSVSFHTVANMLGEQIVWLPMNSMGKGTASGIEISTTSRLGARFQILDSIAYSRAKFAGSDGALRASNFDLPWIVNAAGVWNISRLWLFSARYGFASGRPYTPFDVALSHTQNRPIYDLTRENRVRTPYYERLDVQIRKEFCMHKTFWPLYGGVDNVLNRSNLLSYVWRPRFIDNNPADQVGAIWQTPIFPNFGVRLLLR